MSDLKQWAIRGGAFMPCGQTVERLKPGFYKPGTTGGMFPQLVVEPVNLVTDNLLFLQDSPVEKVTTSIKRFWSAEHKYKKNGIIHKRSILLEGPPGTGKTSICNMIAKFVVEQGGIVFFSGARNIYPTSEAVSEFRQIQNEPLLIIVEEFDRLDEEDEVDMMMQMMDGIDQINNVVYLCTTNYIDKIDHRFTKRPSRIDEIIHVGLPTATARQAYLEIMLTQFDGTKEEVAEYAAKTDGLLLSHLKEVVIATKILDHPLDFTIERMRSMVPSEIEFDFNALAFMNPAQQKQYMQSIEQQRRDQRGAARTIPGTTRIIHDAK